MKDYKHTSTLHQDRIHVTIPQSNRSGFLKLGLIASLALSGVYFVNPVFVKSTLKSLTADPVSSTQAARQSAAASFEIKARATAATLEAHSSDTPEHSPEQSIVSQAEHLSHHVEANTVAAPQSKSTTDSVAKEVLAEAAYTDEPQFHEIWIHIKIEKGDNLSKIFNRLGFSHKDAIELAAMKGMKPLKFLTVGKKLEIKVNDDHKFAGLQYRFDTLKSIYAEKSSDGKLISQVQELETSKRIRDVTATVKNNLFTTADDLNIPSNIVRNLSNIFQWDIDFSRDLNNGDRFSVIYEQEYIGNELISNGDILAAEFIIDGKATRAIRHKDKDGNSLYYTPDGKSLRKAFMRNPLRYARVSSKFSKRRFHPVLKKWRSHKGVDYASPAGTPIMSTADGKITHIGRKGAYGKAVVIDHGHGYTTLYGHMKGFKKGLKKGAAVKQGQVIGYVGRTGLATGNHLHYEFRIKNKHVDPLAVKLPRSLPMNSKEYNQFVNASKDLIQRLDELRSADSVAAISTLQEPSI